MKVVVGVLVVLVAAASAAPMHRHHAVREDESLASALQRGALDPNVYDLEAARIVADAHPSVHNFLSMLAEDEDENVNMHNLASVFLELFPVAVGAEGDFDDGGPESLSSLSHVQAHENAPILSTLGHEAASPVATTATKEETQMSLVGVSASKNDDASVLTPNAAGSKFSSGVSQKFTDNTANLAQLTRNVDELRFRLDQMQRLVKRTMKCKVNPAACQQAVPERQSKPKEECHRRWKYLCRSTYELTPGASAAAGPASATTAAKHASVVLLHHSAHTHTPSVEKPLLGTPHDEQNDEAAVLRKVVEKQMHELDEQTRLLKKAASELQQLRKQQLLQQDALSAAEPVIVEGSDKDTGAHRARDHSVPQPETQTESQKQEQQPQALPVETQQQEQQPVAVETQQQQNVPAETVAESQQGAPQNLPVAQPKEDSQQSEALGATGPITLPTPPESTQEQPASEQEQSVASEQQQQVTAEQQVAAVEAQSVSAEQEAPATAAKQDAAEDAFMKESIGETGNIQLATTTTTTTTPNLRQHQPRSRMTEAERQQLMEEAKQRAMRKAHRQNQQQNTHQRAAEWAKVMLHSHPNGQHSNVFVPDHLRDLVSLTQLSEGVQSMGMPSDEDIHRLALSAYNEEHFGTTSFVEEAEGSGNDDKMPSMEIVHQLALHAAQQAATATATTTKSSSRGACARRDSSTGACEEYADGTKCLVTGPKTALCGFVNAASKKREFTTVPLSSLM